VRAQEACATGDQYPLAHDSPENPHPYWAADTRRLSDIKMIIGRSLSWVNFPYDAQPY
jgi:hypothetical protein